MSSGDHAIMGAFLREVSGWRWDEFWRAERDESYTSNQSIIFALIRSCAMEDLTAIKLSLNRLDGKLKTPIIIETPKVFYLFPNATINAQEKVNIEYNAKVEGIRMAMTPGGPSPVSGEVIPAETLPDPEPEENDLPSLSLRQTLTKMSNFPRSLPKRIVDHAQKLEEALRNERPIPATVEVPMVKSVVAAHLLVMAQSRDIQALTEVFDQIDGKLAETIQIIGEDIYITSYSTTAPPDAILNENGILQSEAAQSQQVWAQKLGAA